MYLKSLRLCCVISNSHNKRKAKFALCEQDRDVQNIQQRLQNTQVWFLVCFLSSVFYKLKFAIKNLVGV